MADQVFVKYCPLCGTENPRNQAFCLSCLDGNLSTVPAEPRRAKPPQVTKPVTTPEAVQQVIDAPPPLPQTECEPDTLQVGQAARCVLELIDDPHVSFAVAEGQVVGRTSKADLVLQGVPKLDWISSTHAKFFRRGEQWYVQHVGQTNFIKVDGEMYRGTEEVALHEGSILVLSLTAFRVKLGGA